MGRPGRPFLPPGLAGAAVNCPDGVWLSVRVEGPHYVGPGETVTYSCVIDSGVSGGTYEWSIGDFIGPTNSSSITLTAPMDASTSPGDQLIRCTYTPPSGTCYESDSMNVTVLKEDGLMAFYPFSGNAADESGNGYDGTVIGATLTTDRFGRSGYAYYFDGVNDRVSLPAGLLNLERTESFTQSFWIKTDDTDTGNNFITKMNPAYTSNNRGIGIVLSSGILRIHLISDGPNGNLLRVEGTTLLNDDEWHHVAVTYNGSSLAAGLTVYLDGGLETTTIVKNALTGTILNTSLPSFGARNTQLPYQGAIDNVRIYNRVLSVSEITDLLYEETGDDWDGDGLSYSVEHDLGTDPMNDDSDGDGLPDGYEYVTAGLDPTVDDATSADIITYITAESVDPDYDGVPDWYEDLVGTNPDDYFD